MGVQVSPSAPMKKANIIVVAGPTSSGKTAYAIKLAQKVGGEIVSADSRQVYRGLDLLSGKVTKKEMAGIPHHLLDVANPKKQFAVSLYKKLADKAILDILSRGKVPIICGGTGFYINTVVYDRVLPDVPPDKNLRKKLERKNAQALFRSLQKIDPARARSIDPHNKVRLIRAIEIARTLGSVPKLKKPKQKYATEWIMLDLSDEVLKKKIHARLLERMQKGMIREAKKLHASGVSFKRMENLGLECRSTARFLQGKISKQEMVTELERDIWQYAKRQRTWFKRAKNR